ncbi:MAG: universal stress protein [Nitrosopumilus sp.]|nr:universal stress protein [Nitrosopumilus sp.]MDH3341128.1 universal stress protein [Nitrosopumilus sp.]
MPLDGSKNSLRGLKFALGIAKQSGSSVVGLNVCSPPMFMETQLLVISKIKRRSNEIIKQAEKISQKNKVPFFGVVKASSNIGKAIITCSKNHNVEMIVTGSRGPDPELEIFLGSVANYVVNKSKIPVTIVK